MQVNHEFFKHDMGKTIHVINPRSAMCSTDGLLWIVCIGKYIAKELSTSHGWRRVGRGPFVGEI